MSKMDFSSAEQAQLARLQALRDEDIDVVDIPELPAENWKDARRGGVRVDRDVLNWFEKHADGNYAAEINKVLRRYVAEHEEREGR